MQVESYDLLLDVDFSNLRFKGRALIELECEETATLDSLGLKILDVKAGGKHFQFKQNNESLLIETGPFRGALEIEYVGLIPDTLAGIYRAPYDGTHMVTTQFEAANARRMFPCVDHPNCKAEFKLAVKIDRDLDAISNMPVEFIDVEGDGKTVSFQKTPRMSTYLLYLGIGDFEEYRERLGEVDLIAATAPGNASKGKFALDIAKKSMEFYQSYFGMPYALPKVHLIAVPEFAAGAMENWGAITFRETAFLVDENSSVKARKRVAEVVAHELAHQWFGNLVTMKWWDELWLNESFATFMSYKVLNVIYPEQTMWGDFLRNETSGAMVRDSLKNTHPIEVDVKSPDEIEQIFDEISYGKGASILRMIEAYIGPDDFRKGIERYLTRYGFSNATGEDLWNSLEEISGKQVKMIMSRWIRKPGYPIVTATVSRRKLALKQERFLLSGQFEKDFWPIPITMELDGRSRGLLFDNKEEIVDIEGARLVRLNVDRAGFYRMRYEGLHDHIWRTDLSAFDRWGIVSDALSILMAGRMSFRNYLRLLRRYCGEQDHLPAREVSDHLSFLHSIVPSEVAEFSTVFHRAQMKILDGKKDDESSMLRGIIAGRLAMVDSGYAKKLGSRFHNYEQVEPDAKDAVAVAYARAYSDFEGILEKYRESHSDEEGTRLLNSMMKFREESLVALSLGLALSGEVKRQDVGSMIIAAAMNPDVRETAWKWLKVHVGRLRALYEGTGTLSRTLLSVIPFLGIERVREVERFFEENKIPEAEKGVSAGLEKLRICNRVAKSICQEKGGRRR